MPIYVYACEKCGHEFELIQKFSDPPANACPKCGGPVRKVITSPGIQFKGSGWYVTDYSNKLKGKKEKEDSGKTETKTGESPAGQENTERKKEPSGSTAPASPPKKEGTPGA